MNANGRRQQIGHVLAGGARRWYGIAKRAISRETNGKPWHNLCVFLHREEQPSTLSHRAPSSSSSFSSTNKIQLYFRTRVLLFTGKSEELVCPDPWSRAHDNSWIRPNSGIYIGIKFTIPARYGNDDFTGKSYRRFSSELEYVFEIHWFSNFAGFRIRCLS